jgi:predicted transcriptional regulator
LNWLTVPERLCSSRNQNPQSVSEVKANFFSGSVSSFVSFFLQEEQMSKEELEEIARLALSLSASTHC